ncbi:hypothetical protein HNQ94_003537 [Salirhabdus euzebyi]|uniref:Pyridoxal phosphate homeostasis protein n=1 Tax=Salirhabdus euzebyi TaxID=394506 RepID=A0A841Q9R4_9BACI|nr:YggS family pyridoxal phosphate-dependent enzyme [Salirhabdus euzebyi]MBB6455043.1 hypothetical protein [Salirhabdus euzebyi]
MNVVTSLADIKEYIEEACKKHGRNTEEVNIIAVTKYVSIDRAKQAVEAGVVDLGENRVEGFQSKYDALGNRAKWHFIGTLQSRKVKDIIEQVDYVHSLDRLSLAKEINKRATRKISCFIQVNVSGEESKHGMDPENVLTFVEKLKAYENIQVVGLMTMAPFTEDESLLRNCFRSLRQLRDNVRELGLEYAPCAYLSMGMSNDFPIAVEEGATHIRIGTKLVGKELE